MSNETKREARKVFGGETFGKETTEARGIKRQATPAKQKGLRRSSFSRSRDSTRT